jgi:tRNA threonylcarbamoyl adenosine modification protein (Sua5/YciO/YrdC/YwlC family)
MRADGVVVYPTDTVYGLGCDMNSKKALDRVRRIKKIDPKRPLTFVFADLKQIALYAQVTDNAYRILRRFLPGAYTFILKATRLVPRIVLTKRDEVGIRIPDNLVCLAMVAKLGNPILSSSVRLPDDQLWDDPREIDEAYKGRVDLVVDGGAFLPAPSSIVSLVDDEPAVIREGKGDVSFFM